MRKLSFKTIAIAFAGVLLTAYLVFQIRSGFTGGAAATPVRAANLRDNRLRVEGRMAAYPGAQVVVGTDFAGTISRLLVNEKDVVHRGDVLAEIRADEERAELAEAKRGSRNRAPTSPSTKLKEIVCSDCGNRSRCRAISWTERFAIVKPLERASKMPLRLPIGSKPSSTKRESSLPSTA